MLTGGAAQGVAAAMEARYGIARAGVERGWAEVRTSDPFLRFLAPWTRADLVSGTGARQVAESGQELAEELRAVEPLVPPEEGRPPVLFLHMHKAGGSSMCRMATGRLYARERLEGHLNCNTAGDSPCRWDEESATLPVAAGAGFGAACSLRLQVMRQGGRDGAGLRGQGAAATGPWTFAGIERFYSDVVDPKSGRLCPGFLYLLLLREPVARIVSHLKFETFSLVSVRRWMRPMDGPPGDNPAQLERDTKVSCGKQMVDAVNAQGIRHKHPLGSIITGSPIVDNFYTRCVVLSSSFVMSALTPVSPRTGRSRARRPTCWAWGSSRLRTTGWRWRPCGASTSCSRSLT